MEIKYFEIIFSDDDHEPECLADEAMCIKGYRQPSIEEANMFCKYEVENKTISYRLYSSEETTTVSQEEFISLIEEEIKTKGVK